MTVIAYKWSFCTPQNDGTYSLQKATCNYGNLFPLSNGVPNAECVRCDQVFVDHHRNLEAVHDDLLKLCGDVRQKVKAIITKSNKGRATPIKENLTGMIGVIRVRGSARGDHYFYGFSGKVHLALEGYVGQLTVQNKTLRRANWPRTNFQQVNPPTRVTVYDVKRNAILFALSTQAAAPMMDRGRPPHANCQKSERGEFFNPVSCAAPVTLSHVFNPVVPNPPHPDHGYYGGWAPLDSETECTVEVVELPYEGRRAKKPARPCNSCRQVIPALLCTGENLASTVYYPPS